MGEFNVWDDGREASDEDRRLGSVTALTVDCTDSVMFTGNSMGYLQVCLLVMYENAHLGDVKLYISASVSCFPCC